MTKLESIMPQLYKDMHAAGVFLGTTWREHVTQFANFIGHSEHTDRTDVTPIIDYGCGPTGGLVDLYKEQTIPYDPYLEKYHAEPWNRGAKTFFSCDVFEHMTMGQLRWVVSKIIKQKSITRVFVALSTRSANKIMPNGMNAHLTIRTPDWWQGFFEYQLGQHFECVIAESNLHRSDAVFAFKRLEPEKT